MLGIRGRKGIQCVLGNGRTLHEPLGAWDWGRDRNLFVFGNWRIMDVTTGCSGFGVENGIHCLLGNGRTLHETTGCMGLGVESATSVCLRIGGQWT